jgi:formylglycine-generating enzyme
MGRVGRPAATVGARALLLAVGVGCTCEPPSQDERGGDGKRESPVAAPVPRPRVLYLPDAAPPATPVHELPTTGAPVLPPLAGRCPMDMVDVQGRFCIDRYEAILVDADSGRTLSPYYHPTRGQTRATFERWRDAAPKIGSPEARLIGVPAPPPWQLDELAAPRAMSLPGVVPNGYLNRPMAEAACQNAGKRLCTSEEWVTACRGDRGTQFPYGTTYEAGRCNVFRSIHPAAVLHGNASEGHLDPRLNQVTEGGDPLLRVTGGTPECRSTWGADAIYDMVGNLDEWVSDAGGVFVGGFFSRGTKQGCESRIESHPPQYFDYSLGVRCCR